MNIANIMPGDAIDIELHYTELLIPIEGIYEFVYPTVVGPRYANQLEAEAAGSTGRNPTAGIHIRGGRLRVHERISAQHSQKTAEKSS